MENLYQQTLAAMPVEDVSFILSQIGQPDILDTQPVSGHDVVGTGQNEDDEETRRRRRIEREWPDTDTILSADYYGATYTAEIIPAAKRLKSGKQIRITSGPAQGVVCDSFSEAMITATEQQRADQNLGRKGVSNGWMFWQWDGKPPEYNEARPEGDE